MAGNPTVSDELLRQLAADPSAWVQAHAAMNPVCPSDIQATLAADPVSELVRSA